jgi:hypothetical protein
MPLTLTIVDRPLTNHPDTISNELYQDTNIALLCEDIVNGMIAANEFRGTGANDPALPMSSELLSRIKAQPRGAHHKPLEVIVEIEKRDWEFKIQPGKTNISLLICQGLLTGCRRPAQSGDEHLWKCTKVYRIRIHYVTTWCQGDEDR